MLAPCDSMGPCPSEHGYTSGCRDRPPNHAQIACGHNYIGHSYIPTAESCPECLIDRVQFGWTGEEEGPPYTDLGHTAMAYIAMAYIVMAREGRWGALHRTGPYSHGLYSYGPIYLWPGKEDGPPYTELGQELRAMLAQGHTRLKVFTNTRIATHVLR